jgi:16S rRNA (adenine1518-N6/adenine1519-N6)-dimethyltransferase
MSTDAVHRPRKRFGQNFLHDKETIDRIIQAFDPDPNLAVVEIGPGRGALTIPLLKKVGTVNAIEIDTDLAQRLIEKCKDLGKLNLHIGDALKFDFSEIQPGPLQIIGNLPYNISTPLMFYLLKEISITEFMLLMLQKEVVNRICANHDDVDYGRLSVMIQSRCQVEKLFNVSPDAFTPPPKITSAVVKLIPEHSRASAILDLPLFEQLVRQAFNQRRKTLRNSLKGFVDEDCLKALSIPSTCRAENVSVEDYVNIANQLYHQQNQ